jgi:protein translocase SecG subunit
MDRQKILGIIQIAIAALMMITILLQSKGMGLSGVFGGEGNVYKSKRGLDKFLLIATIVLAIIFVALAFVGMFWK